MKRIYFLFLVFYILASGCSRPENDFSEWRGPNRQGIYYETGLLNSWPETGPELLWSVEGLGAGHSSVGIGHNRIFVNGMPDTLGVLYSFDMDGNLLWKKVYGTEWHKNYTGSRSTPVIAGNLVYLESGMGVVYCFDAFSGDMVWEVDLLEKFNAENIQWGLTETLLIDGENIICTPGGEKHNVVALNRFTGETIWTSAGFGEPAAYCSPVLVEHNTTRLVVNMTATSIIGLDAETGEMYWRVEQMQGNKIHANSPVYSGGVIYCSSSSAPQSSGIVALQLSEDGKSVKQKWRNESFKNLMGGIVLIDDVIYGSTYRKNEWSAIDASTGEEKILSENFGGGVVVYADGLFYLYSEAGEVALVKMDWNTFEIKGRFEVLLGTDQHWAHPVIKDKRLYIRHGDALMVYAVSGV
ncbi:MAG: PQQ-binding-like beta-propeller repeat protein [Mariniphaga sp.]|nr:PQQ-binding-like beta-propeller repeat protein [Mariniphaga sp.]